MAKLPLNTGKYAKEGDVDRSIKILSPTTEVLRVKGKLSYSESSKAWNVLKIKKEVFHIFPQLKDRKKEFSYSMLIPRSFQEAKEKFEELKSFADQVPILLFFEKAEEEIKD